MSTIANGKANTSIPYRAACCWLALVVGLAACQAGSPREPAAVPVSPTLPPAAETLPPPPVTEAPPPTVTPPVSAVPPTLTPASTATPRTTDALCPIVATRTPMPTPIPPSGTPVQSCIADPHVEICLSAITLHVGETLRVQGQAVDIGLEDYDLYVREAGVPDLLLGRVSHGSSSNTAINAGRVLEFVSAQAGTDRTVSFALRARAAGTVELHLSATGEVGCGAGPWTMAGGGSDAVRVVVTP